MNIKFGIDFGGTKIEIVALDGDNGKELYRKRIPTARDDYEKTVSDIANLVLEAESTLGHHGSVGMGMTGLVDRDTGYAKNANTIWVNGQPLLHDLEKALSRKVRIENDANCFAVSEAVDGAGKGHEVVFGAILGTGCGGGIVVNQKVISGVNNIAGQWGHTPLPYTRRIALMSNNREFKLSGYEETAGITYTTKEKAWMEHPGEVCFCGKRGCLETWISGTGFKMDYQRVEKESLSTHDIIANAQQGEPRALFALERYCDRLARALAGVINTIDPHIIVLGGGMSNVEELYDMVPKIWGMYIDSDTVKTQIVPPRHGDSSGVRGAAWLWAENEHKKALPQAA
ncbi:MAG: ROK family protein [Pseudomonadota bacterium]